MKIIPPEQYPQRDQKTLLAFLSECQAQAVRNGRSVLASIALKVRHIDPLAVLQSIYEEGHLHFYLENSQVDEAIAGAEAVVSATFEGADRFAAVQTFIRQTLEDAVAIGDMDAPFSGPHFFCGFTFNAQAEGARPSEMPSAASHDVNALTTSHGANVSAASQGIAIPATSEGANAPAASYGKNISATRAGKGGGAATHAGNSSGTPHSGSGDFAPATVFVPRWQVARHSEGYTAVANILVSAQTDLRQEAARVLAAHSKFLHFDYAGQQPPAPQAQTVAAAFPDRMAADSALAAQELGETAAESSCGKRTADSGEVANTSDRAANSSDNAGNSSGNVANRSGVTVEEVGGKGHYLRAVGEALRRIAADSYEKIVLARILDLHSARPLHPLAALNRLREHYPSCYAFSFANGKGQSFIGCSPERLLRVQDGSILTEALAGSAPRSDSAGQDAYLGSELLHNDKDLREHELVRAQIEADLRSLGVELDAQPAGPRLRKLPNLQHLWTPLGGTLPAGCGLLDVAARLHPTPAVGGVPRAAACKDVPKLEAAGRGLYTGALGWVDAHGNGEMVVALRSGLIDSHRARLYAGAGIVEGSDPEMELRETELKFRPLLDSLRSAAGTPQSGSTY